MDAVDLPCLASIRRNEPEGIIFERTGNIHTRNPRPYPGIAGFPGVGLGIPTKQLPFPDISISHIVRQ